MQVEDLLAIRNGEPRTNRIQLTISARAFLTLQQDGQDFSLSDDASAGPLSSLVNHLVVQYHDQAQISIALQLRRREAELEQILSGMSAGSRRAAIQKLLESYQLKLEEGRDALRTIARQGAAAGQKDHSFLIRLNKPAIEALAIHFSGGGLFAEGRYYDDNIGRYLKFLLEEYARQSGPRREEIFYRPWLDAETGLLTLAANSGQELLVTLHKRHTAAIPVFRPYAVRLDEESRYHYLLGFWDPEETGRWQAACLRLNSLRTVRLGPVCRPLTKAERQDLQRQIAQKGIAYLSGLEAPVTIQVQLTPKGIRLYHSIRHMRPAAVAPPGADGVYTFLCPAYQAKNYFVRFGANARILAPESLRQEVADFYRKGWNANRQACTMALPGRKEDDV